MGNSGEGHLKTCPYESEAARERERERRKEIFLVDSVCSERQKSNSEATLVNLYHSTQ